MKPQARPVSYWEIQRIRTLERGAAAGALILLAMRRRGLAFPWLLVACIGMLLCARALTVVQLIQAGVITPWP